MHGKGDIIILLGRAAVPVPAVSQIIGLHLLQAGVQLLLVKPVSLLFESHVHQDHEKLPVAVRDNILVDPVKPVRQILFCLGTQRLPHLPWGKDDAAGNGGHLHKPLVIIRKSAPVLLMLRIRPIGQSPGVDLLKFPVLATSCPERDQSPQGPGKCLHLNAHLWVSHAAVPQMKPGSSSAVQRCQRIQNLVHPLPEIFF